MNTPKKTRLFRVSRHLLTLVVLCGSWQMANAQGGPPKFPDQFDAANFSGLVHNIEQGQNSIILKVGYFGAHRTFALPQTQALGILRSAAQKAPAGTKSWYLVQAVRAYGALRTSAATREEGITVYSRIFDKATITAVPKDVRPIVLRSIYEYVSAVPSDYVVESNGENSSAQKVLLKALTLQLKLLEKGEDIYVPDWQYAVSTLQAEEAVEAMLEKVLQNPESKRNYAVGMTVAQVLKTISYPKAFKFMKDLEPVLPRNDKDEVTRYYSELAALAQITRTPEVQEETEALFKKLIANSGQGLGKLAFYYFDKKRSKEFEETMAQLRQPQANERDINDAAFLLSQVDARDKEASSTAYKAAVEMLVTYLQNDRTRDAEQELTARLKLADYYHYFGDIEKEKAVLDLSNFKITGDGTDTQLLYQAAISRRKKLQKGTP